MPRTKERTFGRVVRERRRQLDLTHEEVAERVKTSSQYVKHLESGRRHPSDKILTRIADALGLDRLELFLLAHPRAQPILDPNLQEPRVRDVTLKLLKEIKDLQTQGKLPRWPTDEQRIDWAYGNTVIENARITRAMAKKAVIKKPSAA